MTKQSLQPNSPPVGGDYSAPTLSIYGHAIKLTAAGTVGSNEGSMSTDKTRKT